MSSVYESHILLDLEQQSPEWFEMRKGCVTGSMVKNAIAKAVKQPEMTKKCKDGKHGVCDTGYCNCSCHGPKPATIYLQCREDYMMDIVATRLTGRMPARYVTKAMEDGIEREPLALSAYEAKMDVMVEPVGIAFHPEMKWFASSPDALAGSDVVIEAKCPTETTHLRYIKEYREAMSNGLEYVPEAYLAQVKAHLSCTGRSVCHFISFHPDVPKGIKLLISPWRRDKGAIEEQDAEVKKFLDEAAELETYYREMKI